MVQRRRELHAAARHPGVRRRGLQDRIDGNLIGRALHRNVVRRDETGGDRGLRLGAALEQAAFDQQPIGAHAGCHGRDVATRRRLREGMVKAAITGRERWGNENGLFSALPPGAPSPRAPVENNPVPGCRNASRPPALIPLGGSCLFPPHRSSVDCLVRDVSETGAKLVFGEAVAIPDVVELYLSNKDEVRRAKVQWRKGHEMGVDFNDLADAGSTAASGDLDRRVLKLERECASLKRMVSELRADIRRMSSEPV